MPVPLAAKAGIIAVSVAVAAAIAVYESPEIRRMADDLRRRIAIALHSFGDNIDPRREPMFNRPEDAEGFMMSRGMANGADQGVDADEESRRRQREELMYWNQLREEQEEEKRRDAEKATGSAAVTVAVGARPSPSRGSTFDDFLQPDKDGERGTYVYNSGAEIRGNDDDLIRRRGRGIERVSGLHASLYANPFADENGIDYDQQYGLEEIETHALSPGRDEIMSDIYSATTRDKEERVETLSHTLSPQPANEVLFDLNEPQARDNTHADNHADNLSEPVSQPHSATLERELAEDEYMTAGQDEHHDAYASIQAWAQYSNPSFYSPLPMSPPAPLSEPELISEGALTPTHTASIAGSGVDIANDAASSHAGEGERYYDVLSDDEDGIATPGSWSEVASVISESESAVRA